MTTRRNPTEKMHMVRRYINRQNGNDHKAGYSSMVRVMLMPLKGVQVMRRIVFLMLAS